jgi:hypothetical protein
LWRSRRRCRRILALIIYACLCNFVSIWLSWPVQNHGSRSHVQAVEVVYPSTFMAYGLHPLEGLGDRSRSGTACKSTCSCGARTGRAGGAGCPAKFDEAVLGPAVLSPWLLLADPLVNVASCNRAPAHSRVADMFPGSVRVLCGLNCVQAVRMSALTCFSTPVVIGQYRSELVLAIKRL